MEKKIQYGHFFVLDFDGTYDNEEPDSDEVQPMVYLIPLNKQSDVEHYARMAHDDFHSDDYLVFTIADYFEERMKTNDCAFRAVGSIDLTFRERQVDYLTDYIPREIV